jgi:hypothetical protein
MTDQSGLKLDTADLKRLMQWFSVFAASAQWASHAELIDDGDMDLHRRIKRHLLDADVLPGPAEPSPTSIREAFKGGGETNIAEN